MPMQAAALILIAVLVACEDESVSVSPSPAAEARQQVPEPAPVRRWYRSATCARIAQSPSPRVADGATPADVEVGDPYGGSSVRTRAYPATFGWFCVGSEHVVVGEAAPTGEPESSGGLPLRWLDARRELLSGPGSPRFTTVRYVDQAWAEQMRSLSEEIIAASGEERRAACDRARELRFEPQERTARELMDRFVAGGPDGIGEVPGWPDVLDGSLAAVEQHCRAR